jgi:hypothetical protein
LLPCVATPSLAARPRGDVLTSPSSSIESSQSPDGCPVDSFV